MNPEQNGHVPLNQDLCPVQRHVGVIGIPKPTMSLNNRLEQVQQVEVQPMAIAADGPHEWRYVRPAEAPTVYLPWYCIWCCQWRATADVPVRRTPAAVQGVD